MKFTKEFLESRGLTPDKIADTMLNFYRDIDATTARISEELRQCGVQLKCCPGCCDCCVDELSVNRSEEAVIRKLYPNIFEEPPHEPGKCPFLNENGLCRIYEARPFVCRTHGMPLKLVISREEAAELGAVVDGEQDEVELLDICEKNEEGIDIADLPDSAFLSHETCEVKLATMEMATFGEEEVRTDMRDLFVKKS
ncbi:MAG: YkgJ family cysteine cluster protein [Proteobacteria bacterium]|nr:YkgJ family cysteine cluster protein [Pseudomonadota bacterium]